MYTTPVSRVLVWNRWLRLAHWVLAVSVLGLLISGWLMDTVPMLFETSQDFHFIFSALMLPALILRLYLLFWGKGTDKLRDCELDKHKIAQALEVMRFYLTLGRAPLPKWFGHNPLWGPIYLILLLFLIFSSISGLLLAEETTYFSNVYAHDFHRISYYVIALFVALHPPAVFSHDLRGKCSDVSGMISGYRTFTVERTNSEIQLHNQTVSLEELLKSRR